MLVIDTESGRYDQNFRGDPILNSVVVVVWQDIAPQYAGFLHGM